MAKMYNYKGSLVRSNNYEDWKIMFCCGRCPISECEPSVYELVPESIDLLSTSDTKGKFRFELIYFNSAGEQINQKETFQKDFQYTYKARIDPDEFTPMWKKQLRKIEQCPQRQDSLVNQLKDLRVIANKFGLYNAADYLKP